MPKQSWTPAKTVSNFKTTAVISLRILLQLYLSLSPAVTIHTSHLKIESFTLNFFYQSIENAHVAFVKGADERNKFFEKNKQSVKYDKQVQANKAKN